MKPEKHGAINVMAQGREDGRITVTVRLVGWEPRHLTSLGHNPDMQSRIANRIAMEVYTHFGVDPERD